MRSIGSNVAGIPSIHEHLSSGNHNAVIAGRAHGEAKKKRTLLAVVAKVEKHIPKEWLMQYGAVDLARIKALAVRSYREGHEDGYSGGYTAGQRSRTKKEAA